jgi:hypothetical protein
MQRGWRKGVEVGLGELGNLELGELGEVDGLGVAMV